MSPESVYLHNPELAKCLDQYAQAMDASGLPDAPIVLFKPRYKEAKRRGVLVWRGHPLIEGPATRRRYKKPEELSLL